MAATQEDSLSIVNEILKELKHIATAESPLTEEKKQSVRFILDRVRRDRERLLKEKFPAGVKMPILIEHVVPTFLGVGAGQELVQRFCLEYLLKAKKPNIGMVMMSNPKDFSDNYIVALVGSCHIREELAGEIRSNHRSGDFSEKASEITLETFWAEQKDGVIWVDPLSGFTCLKTNTKVPEAMMEAYGSYSILHTSTYEKFPNAVLHAPVVKVEAQTLATFIRWTLIKELLEAAIISNPLGYRDRGVWQYHSGQDCFFLKGEEKELMSLFEKFKQTYGFSSGPTGRVDIVRGVQTGTPMLVFKNVNQTPLINLGRIITNIGKDTADMAALFGTALQDLFKPSPGR
jgi:hypothetical protein